MYICAKSKVVGLHRLHCPFSEAALLQQQLLQAARSAANQPVSAHLRNQSHANYLVLSKLRTALQQAALTDGNSNDRSAQLQQTPVDSHSYEQYVAELTTWHSTYGTCHVPSTATDAAALCRWVSRVRKAAKKGLLNEHQKQQLNELGFIWKPETVDALWHAQYHKLRCWLRHSSSNSLQELLQYEARLKLHGNPAMPDESAEQTTTAVNPAAVEGQSNAERQKQLIQRQQQQHDMHEIVVWLARQVELYGKLKLTPVKVTMLRKLGVKLKRQAGLTKPNLHPVLQGKDPATYQRRPIQVDTVTPQGRAAVGRLLHRQQQQQSAETGTTLAHDSSKQGIINSVSHDPDASFMLMLAQLQCWRKRYGSCHVPAGVFDQQQLAEWVQHVRRARAAPNSSSSSSDGRHPSGSSSQSSGASSSSARSADSAKPYLQPQQLKPWHDQELRAVGFAWTPSEADEAWHTNFHRLRQFKLTHHHLDLARASTVSGQRKQTGPAEAAAFAATAGDSNTDCGWSGLAEWLQQQTELMAASSNTYTPLQQQQQRQEFIAGQASHAGEAAKLQRLSNMQLRLLRNLGVKAVQS